MSVYSIQTALIVVLTYLTALSGIPVLWVSNKFELDGAATLFTWCVVSIIIFIGILVVYFTVT